MWFSHWHSSVFSHCSNRYQKTKILYMNSSWTHEYDRTVYVNRGFKRAMCPQMIHFCVWGVLLINAIQYLLLLICVWLLNLSLPSNIHAFNLTKMRHDESASSYFSRNFRSLRAYKLVHQLVGCVKNTTDGSVADYSVSPACFCSILNGRIS